MPATDPRLSPSRRADDLSTDQPEGTSRPPLHIGLNLLYLLPGVVGGTETYARGLIDALPSVDSTTRYTVFLNEECTDWPLPSSSRFSRVVCPVRARSRAGRYLWEQLSLPRVVKRAAVAGHGLDVLHSLGYVMPLRAPCPTVVTIHDLNYRQFGRRMPLARRLMLSYFVEQSARRATQVITVSEFSRMQLLAALPVHSTRVHVTHEAALPSRRQPSPETVEEVRRRLELSPRYLVAFGSSSPNKNIPRLVEAFSRAKRQAVLPQELVLVGHPPTAGEGAVTSTNVRVLGYLDDATLAAVLAGGEGLVFPSLYEGFGLPILEAMRSGVPVACSNVASLPEVAGDAAIYFDPLSVEQLAAAIIRLTTDASLRQSLRARGFARERTFTWQRTARETMDVYRAATGSIRPAQTAPAR